MSGGSKDTSPVLITHWDPDLYPGNAMPSMRELAVQVLTSRVLIKDVDLLLNRKIRESFRDPAVVRQFESLLHTGRIQVLVPRKAMLSAVDVDPDKKPMTAVLRERQKKARPLKTRMPKIGRPDERFCTELDHIMVSAKAVRFRQDFATEKHLRAETWHFAFQTRSEMASAPAIPGNNTPDGGRLRGILRVPAASRYLT
jgi:hypothetical protein